MKMHIRHWKDSVRDLIEKYPYTQVNKPAGQTTIFILHSDLYV